MSARRGLPTLALLVAAQLVVMLDTSIVNVALPSIQADLGLGATSLTWVVNAYVLTFGGLLLLSGRLADRLGRRTTLMGGALVFTAGTLLAAAAPGAAWLVAGRVVQGVGAAALSPAAMSLLLVTFPGASRARAMSAWGAASTLGGATGVLAGGVLTGAFGWSSVFLVTVPASVAIAVLARRVLPADPPRRRGTAPVPRFDALGAVLATGGVVALVHGALAATTSWTSTAALGGLVAAAVLLAAFVAVERRAADPLVPPALMRSPALRSGVALAVLGGAARASTFMLVALLLQQVLRLEPGRAGLAMLPTSLTGFVVSLALLPRVLRAIGPRRTLVAGLVVLAAGHAWLATRPAGGYAGGVLPGLVLVAVGVALSFTPTTMLVAAAAPPDQAGTASGLASAATQVGAALGTSAFTAVGLAVAGSADGTLGAAGFRAAFVAAAAVALTTAALGARSAREGVPAPAGARVPADALVP